MSETQLIQPLPWTAVPGRNSYNLYLVIDSGGVTVFSGVTKDEAALIVRAVNHHDALVAALRRRLANLTCACVEEGEIDPACELCAAHALLAALSPASTTTPAPQIEPYVWRVGDVFTDGDHRWVVTSAIEGGKAVLQSCSSSWAKTRPLTFDEWHEGGRWQLEVSPASTTTEAK